MSATQPVSQSATRSVAYGEAGIPSVTPETFWEQDEEFRDLQLNLIKIHIVSEDYGADCFEPSILRAPTPEAKMRMAKTVMEEYGHHLRFRALLDELGLDWREFSADKDHLTTFDTPRFLAAAAEAFTNRSALQPSVRKPTISARKG